MLERSNLSFSDVYRSLFSSSSSFNTSKRSLATSRRSISRVRRSTSASRALIWASSPGMARYSEASHAATPTSRTRPKRRQKRRFINTDARERFLDFWTTSMVCTVDAGLVASVSPDRADLAGEWTAFTSRDFLAAYATGAGMRFDARSIAFCPAGVAAAALAVATAAAPAFFTRPVMPPPPEDRSGEGGGEFSQSRLPRLPRCRCCDEGSRLPPPPPPYEPLSVLISSSKTSSSS
mmetsp:Transcript_20639/g.59939  ORF Transcript_20639/g.59939 Transcript_20639/m.59939 type:complete len:236 (-) Transcript_20639:193-900(-)